MNGRNGATCAEAGRCLALPCLPIYAAAEEDFAVVQREHLAGSDAALCIQEADMSAAVTVGDTCKSISPLSGTTLERL